MKRAGKVVNLSGRFKALSFFLLLFLLWLFAAPQLARYLIVEKPLAQADAMLVLAGAHTYVERTQKAAEIFKTGAAPKIYLTDDGVEAGWSRRERRNPKFVELARDSLVSQGVPPQAIEILPGRVSGTIDEARLLAEKARAAELKSLLLVTSAYHTRRALWTFERVFAENNEQVALGIASPPAGEQTPPAGTWWLSVFGWQTVAGEYVKFAVYWAYY